MLLQPVNVRNPQVERVRRDLIGAKNGVNLVFNTPETFVASGLKEEWILLNGVFLARGVSDDYEILESGGVGTGFDTVILKFPPISTDRLEGVYVPQ